MIPALYDLQPVREVDPDRYSRIPRAQVRLGTAHAPIEVRCNRLERAN